MVSSKSLIAGLFAGIALCAVSSAQQAKDFDKVEGPLGRVHYDLSQGKVTKVVRPRQVAAQQNAQAQRMGQRAVVHNFRNTITTGYFFSGTLGATDLDWSDKATGYQAVNAFVIGYATYAWDPSGGPGGTPGPGASMIVSFYTGTTGFCNLGNQVVAFGFTGLPGVTSCLGPGSGAGYTVTAFPFPPSFCMPDGQIGWGYTHTDDRGLVTLSPPSGASGTGAIMVNFGTHETTGWDDAFDIWLGFPASTASCSGTWWFGGCNTADTVSPIAPPCASYYLALQEHDSALAAAVQNNGTGLNPLNLAATSLPRVGQVFTGTFIAPPPFFTGGWVAATGPFLFNFNGPLLYGQLLVNLGTLLPGVKITTGAVIAPIPCDIGLIGITAYIQSFHILTLGPVSVQLHNRLDLTFGG
jgi:hypothetical protein